MKNTILNGQEYFFKEEQDNPLLLADGDDN